MSKRVAGALSASWGQTSTTKSSLADPVVSVVADADVLFGATTRGLLIHLDFLEVIRLHWSPLILEELNRALVDTGRKPSHQAAARHERLLRAALPHADVQVTVVQKHFQAVAAVVRSAKDIHVAACAHTLVDREGDSHASSVKLVTNNVRDFHVRKLGDLGIAVIRPDAFLLELWGQDAAGMAAAFAALRATLRSAPTPAQLLERLSADGQIRTAAVLRDASRRDAVSL